MKSIVDYINESINNNVTRNVKVSVPGKKSKQTITVYSMNDINEDKFVLDYDSQILFKHYCFYKWDIPYDTYPELDKTLVPEDSFDEDKLKSCDFYFDDIYCVDATSCRNIPKIKCDGSLTFYEARIILEKYLQINTKYFLFK